MDRQHLDSKFACRLHSALNGIRDVVVFQVEENFCARIEHFSNDRRSGRSEKLVPNLEKSDSAPNFSDEFLSGGWSWNIQWNNDPVLCRARTFHRTTMHGDL